MKTILSLLFLAIIGCQGTSVTAQAPTRPEYPSSGRTVVAESTQYGEAVMIDSNDATTNGVTPVPHLSTPVTRVTPRQPRPRLSDGTVGLFQHPSGLWVFQWVPNDGRDLLVDCRTFMLPRIIEQNPRQLAQALRRERAHGDECGRYLDAELDRLHERWGSY